MTDIERSGADSPRGESAPEPATGLPPSRRLETLTGVLALALSAAMILLSRDIQVNRETGGVDPRWWPTVLGSIALVLGVFLIIVALTRTLTRDDVEPTSRTGRINAVVTVAVAVAYALAWPVVGFLPATFALLLILTAVFGARSWKVLVLFPLALTGFLYILFATLLKVPL